MRQVPDETNGIGQNHTPAIRQLHGAQSGIQCGKQKIGHPGAGIRELIEQSRFAGIRVADQGYDGNFVTAALLNSRNPFRLPV